MGLDTSHDCWHGPYSFFNNWRRAVAEAIGIEDLDLHWARHNAKDPDYCEPDRPLMVLLNHSDCDGQIESKDCAAIADDLEHILKRLDDYGPYSARQHAMRWIKGLRAAAAAGESVQFH